ncbi:MAG: DNA polymerase I [Acidobacteriia bacterium]|nr:DNA polymerase I [Terriglobia bacterium]
MGKPGKKLFLIDAMSLVFRAFYAPMQMALVSPAGLPTKAVYIFLRTLRKLLKDHHPDHVAVAFDLAAPTFRDKLFEEYKANRPEFPEDLAVQLPYVRRFCRALGLPLVEREGFEADDVIGTLAQAGSADGADVLIVSGDEDLFQLVDDNVRVLKPSRGVSDGETLCDAEKVKDILGVEPSQVVDWLALTGDPSDNIPGARPLPGHEPTLAEGEKKRSYIGPKGATELIQQFGSLEKVLANYEQVKKQSYRDALRDFRQEALLSRELAKIRTDVPLETSLDELQRAPLDLPEVTALCQELGFASLLREFLEEAPAPAETSVESEELETPQAVERWFKSSDATAPLALAMSVDGEQGFAGRLTGLGFSDGKRLATVAVGSSADLLAALSSVLGDPARRKAVHNSKVLHLLVAKNHVALAGVADDTMLYSYLLEPLASSHELADVVLRRQGRKISVSLAEAADRTRELAALLRPEIVRESLQKLYEEIELPLAAVLAEVEAVGVRVDAGILARMSEEFEKELTALTRETYDLAGGSFDIDSPKQLGEILFEKLKLPGGKRLKKSGQYSTEAAVLEALADKHDLPRTIIEYRTRAKLKSTYIDALPQFIHPETGRLHTSFNQTVARTGRLSSSNPNLQNIPIGDEFGQRIRSAFVAEPGWRLISADYSQIELRVLAHLSEDPRLIEAFTRNEDIHARTAQEIFGVPAGLQTHEHRRMAKAINYGVIYGLSSFGLAGRTGSSKTEAQRYIDAYFERYHKVKDYLDGLVGEARSTGRVRTLFGRLRPIPEINSADAPSRNRAEREAMNTPLQGTAADLLKLAMVKVHARLKREKMQTCMILTVHDELVFEAPERELDRAQEIVRSEMEGAYPMRVPLKVDLGVGENWKEAK